MLSNDYKNKKNGLFVFVCYNSFITLHVLREKNVNLPPTANWRRGDLVVSASGGGGGGAGG